MNRPFNKKRFWLVVGIIVVAEVLAIGLILQWRYIFPSREVSDLYTKYAEQEGVDASFIKNYRVNDTVFLDVTLLETSDSATWESLCKDFGIASFSLYDKEYKELMTLEHSFDQRLAFDTLVSDNDSVYIMSLIIYSHLNMSMCIFPNIDDNEYDAIINNKFKEIVY